MMMDTRPASERLTLTHTRGQVFFTDMKSCWENMAGFMESAAFYRGLM